MSFKLAVCSDADMPRFFAVVSDAFGHEHPYFDSVFPHHDTPSGRAAGAERLLTMKQSDPNSTFLKVTDLDTGVIVGVAKWIIWDGIVPDEPQLSGDYWESGEAKEYANDMLVGYMALRVKAVKHAGGHLASLDLLAVDPKHQRQGAGTVLTRWGTDVADSKGLQAVVESSDYGRGVYEKCGFKFLEDVIVSVPEKWGNRPKQRFFWMKRQAKRL